MRVVNVLRNNIRVVAAVILLTGVALLTVSLAGSIHQRNHTVAVANGLELVREELRLAGLDGQTTAPAQAPEWTSDGTPVVPPGTIATSTLLVAKAPDVHANVDAALLHKEDYVLPISAATRFRGGDLVFPKTREALRRALSAVGNAKIACDDGECFNLCDHLVGWNWGYDASGYMSARTHWDYAVKNGGAHPADREPPLGALLFWDSQPNGHVAIYIGNGRVVTNFIGPAGKNVYIADADWYEKNGRNYLGWAEPIFYDQKPGAGL